jgi:hypothetical protein
MAVSGRHQVDENYTLIHALFDYYCARSEDGMHFHVDAGAYKVRARCLGSHPSPSARVVRNAIAHLQNRPRIRNPRKRITDRAREQPDAEQREYPYGD